MSLCYDNAVNILNVQTKERKWLITYYKNYGITIYKKHVDANHYNCEKNWRRNSQWSKKNCWKTTYEKKTTSAISIFLL